jgi:quinoprotein glucose dehydrogenase
MGHNLRVAPTQTVQEITMKRTAGLLPATAGSLLVVATLGYPLQAQDGAANGEWRYYGGDPGSTRYAALDQIHAGNVRDLRIAWRWRSEGSVSRPQLDWQATPLMIGGTLYFTAGAHRTAVAADAATGRTLWTYEFEEGERGLRPARTVNRGLAYWTDGRGDERLLVVTPGYHLIAIDAVTGRLIPAFGREGVVDLFLGLDRDEVAIGSIGATSPAVVVNDVVVVGAALQAGPSPRSMSNVPGYVRGYDVRTGEHLWTFRTIPRPGEFGNETWENDSWRYTGNAGAWAPFSVDEELGYVYVPTENATHDHYGGHRLGDNLFANSLVCLDARTGERVWHFQFSRHDVWDWDIPSPPVLLDVTVDARPIRAVAQPTKQGFLFVFDRLTGEPVWPIEDRPMPPSRVLGERMPTTQPIPTRPAPFDRQGVTQEMLIDFTPELRARALVLLEQYDYGPELYRPPILAGTDGKLGTLMLPAQNGAANWRGGAADPETGWFYISSMTHPVVLSLVPGDPDWTDMDYEGRFGPTHTRGGWTVHTGPDGLPLVAPPWGRITAIDLNTGEHVWMVPNGPGPREIHEHPALRGRDLGWTGSPTRVPLLVTRTLLFTGDGARVGQVGPGAGGLMFRALDKRTGTVVHEMALPAGITGIPMTYMIDGKQYIVMAIGDAGFPGELVALTLP